MGRLVEFVFTDVDYADVAGPISGEGESDFYLALVVEVPFSFEVVLVGEDEWGGEICVVL